MNSSLYRTAMILLFVWLFYQIFNNMFLLLLLIGAIFSFLLYRGSGKEEEKTSSYLWTAIGLLLLSLVFTSAFWAILGVFLVVEFNSNSRLSRTVRDPLFKKRQNWQEKEYISVNWDNYDVSELQFSRHKWFGDDSVGKEVFQWEDKNFIKILGDTFFDLGNTILPKRENIILIRKGLGDTKIIVPRDTALSVDVSMGLGKLVIDKEEYTLKNETVKWYSSDYSTSMRKLKIVTSTLVGEIEVVHL